MNDSTLLQPPDFGPDLPLYPDLPQLVRVSGPRVVGSNVPANTYPGFVRQYATPFVSRDREPCYVTEPNGVQLSPAIYDCRLVNSYLGLPLYATTCCPGGSSSSASAAPIPPIVRTSLGFTSGGYPVVVGSLTLPSITVPSGALLVVVVSILGSGASVGTVTFGAYTLDLDAAIQLPVGAALQGTLACLSTVVPVGQTANILFTPAGSGRLTIQAVQVTGLDGVDDQAAVASGLIGSPDSGASGVTTDAPSYVQGAFVQLVPPGGWAWQNGFVDGGQDVSAVLGPTATVVTEGWAILPIQQTADAALSGVPAAWAGLVSTYF